MEITSSGDKLRLEEYADGVIAKTKVGKRMIALGADKKYAMYLRKSTKGKKRQVRSIKDQKKDCLKEIKRAKIKISENDIFVDRFSAKKPGQRTSFSAMIDLIKKGKYNSIIAYHPDRLARNMKEGGEIIDLIDQSKIIDLKFPTYVFNNDSNGIMSLGIQFVIAKQYSDNLSLSSSRGNRNIATEGKMSNKNKYGYTVDSHRYPIPDGDNFNILKTAFGVALENKPLKVIADWVNTQGFTYVPKVKGKAVPKHVKMTPQILSGILADPFYAGLKIYGINKIWLQKVCPNFTPMVSVEDFMLLRHKMDKTKAFDKKREQPLLLQKMVTCGYCHNVMTPYVSYDKGGKKDRYLYLKCGNKSCETKISSDGGKRSNNSQVRGKVIFEYIYSFLANGVEVTRDDFNEYQDAGQRVLVERKKDLILAIKRENQNLVQLNGDLEIYTKALANSDADSGVTINQKIKSARIEIDEKELLIKNLKTKLDETTDLLQSQTTDFETFSNLFKNLLPIVKNSTDRPLVDKIIKMVFSNFTVKDKKVTNHTLNPDFQERFKHLLIQDCRGYRIRTCNLMVPNHAR